MSENNNEILDTEVVDVTNDAETVEPAEPVEETVESTADQAAFDNVEASFAESVSGTVDKEENSNVLGIMSMVFGILSVTLGCCGFCCCNGWLGVIMSTTAVVLGIISIVKGEDARGMAIAGIACGAVGILIAIVITVKDPFSVVVDNIDRAPIENYIDQIEEIL